MSTGAPRAFSSFVAVLSAGIAVCCSGRAPQSGSTAVPSARHVQSEQPVNVVGVLVLPGGSPLAGREVRVLPIERVREGVVTIKSRVSAGGTTEDAAVKTDVAGRFRIGVPRATVVGNREFALCERLSADPYTGVDLLRQAGGAPVTFALDVEAQQHDLGRLTIPK